MIRSRTIRTDTISAAVREMTAADISLLLHENEGISFKSALSNGLIKITGEPTAEDIGDIWKEFIELNQCALISQDKPWKIEDGFVSNQAESHDRGIIIACENMGFDVWNWPMRLILQYCDILKERNRGR